MKKVDAGHLPSHITEALNDAGIDERDLDSAIEALSELGVHIIVRDNPNGDSFALVPFSELHDDVEIDDDGDPVNDPITDTQE